MNKIIKKTKRNKAVVRDSKKESLIRDLSTELKAAGFVVRREKLKQGFGWKVMSGECMHTEQNMIFVDSRMPQDEQIAFLKQKIHLISLNQGEPAEVSA